MPLAHDRGAARWGDAEAGGTHLELLRSFGIDGTVRAEVLATITLIQSWGQRAAQPR